MTEPKKTRRSYESTLPLGSLRIASVTQEEERDRPLNDARNQPDGENHREEVVTRLIDRIKKI